METRQNQVEGALSEANPTLLVAPSPHVRHAVSTTRRMMLDVLIALVPAIAVSYLVFGMRGLTQILVCVLACLVFEAFFTKLRSRTPSLHDLSAVVTGVILGLSLPALAPPYVAVLAAFIAIGVGKVAFGGLGFNLFNPAMVGRAFVMMSFAAQMGAPAYVLPAGTDLSEEPASVLTQATPLTVAKTYLADRDAGKLASADSTQELERAGQLDSLFLGRVNGSIGETSALALLLGGLYLCWRRSASWEIPAGVLGSSLILAQLAYLAGLTPFDGLQHLLGGALLFGAFFIATDPVSSPLVPRGKWIFGIGVGVFAVLIRVLSSYPEGVMFAVLFMNATVPLLNRFTIPRPLGAPLSVEARRS